MKYILLLLLFCTSVSIAQSPWTREQGKSYVQLGVTSLNYSSYEFNGNSVDYNGNINDFTIQAYAEYGISNRLEIDVVLPYKIISTDNAGISENISALGNVSVGLKYKLYDKTWKVSSGIRYDAKSIKIDYAKGLSTGFNAATILPYISVGSSKNKWYYFGMVGYGYMNNNYSDYLKATVEVGYEVIKRGHLILIFDTRNRVSKEAAFETDVAQWPSYLDRQTFDAIGLKVNYEFKQNHFGVNFAVIGAPGIDNAPIAPTFNLGIYSKF